MKLVEFLDSKDVQYEISRHRPTFSAQQMAAEEHVSGMTVAKPVIVKADNEFCMCVLPACCKIDLDKLKKLLHAESLELSSEDDMVRLFPDCEVGAEPPFGNLYGLRTILDKTIDEDEYIICQAGSHDRAVKIRISDYKKITEPAVMSFSFHSS